jgi:hypothetical protein
MIPNKCIPRSYSIIQISCIMLKPANREEMSLVEDRSSMVWPRTPVEIDKRNTKITVVKPNFSLAFGLFKD